MSRLRAKYTQRRLVTLTTYDPYFDRAKWNEEVRRRKVRSYNAVPIVGLSGLGRAFFAALHNGFNRGSKR